MVCNNCGFNYDDNEQSCPYCGTLKNGNVTLKQEFINEASQIPYDNGLTKSIVITIIAGVLLGIGINFIFSFIEDMRDTKIIFLSVVCIPVSAIIYGVASMVPNKNKFKYRRQISQLAFNKYNSIPAEDVNQIQEELVKQHSPKTFISILLFVGYILVAALLLLIFKK